MRILVAGFQHETNTFAVGPPASYDSFVNGEGGFPALRRGGDSVHELEEVNIPMEGSSRSSRAMVLRSCRSSGRGEPVCSSDTRYI